MLDARLMMKNYQVVRWVLCRTRLISRYLNKRQYLTVITTVMIPYTVKLQYNILWVPYTIHFLITYVFLGTDTLGWSSMQKTCWLQPTLIMRTYLVKTYEQLHPVSMITSDTAYFFIAVHVVQQMVASKCQSACMYSTCRSKMCVRGLHAVTACRQCTVCCITACTTVKHCPMNLGCLRQHGVFATNVHRKQATRMSNHTAIWKAEHFDIRIIYASMCMCPWGTPWI